MAFPNNPTSPPVLELNSHAINTSCVGFWPLTQVQGTTATDISTGGNDGTLSGVAGWASGSIGNAADIPTGTGNISIGTTSDFVFSDTGTMSVSFWAYFDSDNSRFAVLGTGITTAGDDWFVSREYLGGTGLNCLRFGMNYNNTPNATFARVTPDNSATAGTWNHWVIVASGGSSLTIYKDGVSQSLTTLSTEDNGLNGSATANTHELQLGSTGSTLYGTCDLQNVRIWDTALSASDVALLYSRPWVGTDYDELWPYSPPVPSSMSLSTDTAATSLNSGCVAWWPLTEGTGTVAADIVGTNDGTLTNSPAWQSAELGKTLEFDKTASQSVVCSSSTTVSDATYSIWVYTNPTAQNGVGLFGDGGGGDYDTLLYLTSSGTVAYFYFKDNAGTAYNTVSSPVTVPTGEWYHLCVTKNGTALKIYVNGVEEASVTVGSSTVRSSFATGIGASYDATSHDGFLQNARIWDRALTADEVTLLYERPWEGEATYGDALYNDPPPTLALGTTAEDVAINTGCVGWWPLLETDDYASGAADISGNGNNGTQSGGVLSAYSPLGGVASFDGTDDYFDTGSSGIVTSFPITVSAWVKAGGTTRDVIFGSFYAVGTSRSFQCEVTAAGKMEIISSDNGSYQATNKVTGTTTLSTSDYSHVVFVFEGSGGSLYLNGVAEPSTGSLFATLNTPVVNCLIGAEGTSGSTAHYFDGHIQNVRVWSRALSAVEVQSLYETPWIGSNYGAVAAFYNYIFRSKRFRRL